MATLTPYERETIVNWNEAGDTASVLTYDRRLITSLRKNPAATEVHHDQASALGAAEFEFPKSLVNFRRPRRASTRSSDPKAAADRMAKARAARGGK